MRNKRTLDEKANDIDHLFNDNRLNEYERIEAVKRRAERIEN